MAQPKWQTAAGSLATIPEGVFYQIQLEAIDPDNPLDPAAVQYKVIAGSLPLGIQCTLSGELSGVPYFTSLTTSVTSKFVIRAYTDTNIADRTFEITVALQNDLRFLTPAGNIGSFYDGGPIPSVKVLTSDPTQTVISLAAGQLPPGLSLSTDGTISGYIVPLIPSGRVPGFDVTGQTFDEFPFDFYPNSLSQNYQFTLEANNGLARVLQTFEIYVYSRSSLTADTIDFTVDNTFITADETPLYTPFIVNAQPSLETVEVKASGVLLRADNTFIRADQTETFVPVINDLGTTRSDNFWAYRLIGLDFDSDVIEYLEYINEGLALPPGITLDLQTGWLYGYIPSTGFVEQTYEFAVVVRKAFNPQYVSNPYFFALTLTGPVNSDITWLTDSNLGTIDNGSTSTLYVAAVSASEQSLQYRLAEGSYPVPNIGVYNKLPQGLQLLSSGEIAGRVSFNTFALDLGNTTFDKSSTTFDLKYTFTVNVYSIDGVVNQFKTFTITVNRRYNEPYENLYIKCMPPETDRGLINQLIQNQDIIPVDLVYRPGDPNFGVAKNVVYHHAFGLSAVTYEQYVSSLVINHYWKNLTLGEIKTARALDDAGNVLYEVVYSEIIDNLVNSQGQSVSKNVTLPYPINQYDSTEIDTVYPNSLINMRNQVIDTVGQVSNVLPRWMISRQANGQVLGFTPAWVICYAKPGTSGRIAYNIAQQYGTNLHSIDFEVDRYELDRLLTKHWDPIADSANASWITNNPEEPQLPAATTFDLENHYELVAIGNYYSSPYAVGDKILILGSQIGGQDGLNNVTITVLAVNVLGGIVSVNLTGLAPIGTNGDLYYAVAGTNISGTGSGAVFDLVVGSGNRTTFDSTSLRFIAPVDMYSSTDVYDKYLVFPKRNILV